MTYESSVGRLEEIVRQLAEEELSLDAALALFEEGVTRLREASEELARAEARVKVLRESADGCLDATDRGD